ncbi:hypothetical protein C2S53_010110 [Perilla frutescens var. hirtella]|uniref:F-box domain-containing protein n=1 Tax=Perilla frutescens var. hirtella TaxID=608512 RepID=A0AAD4P8A6_PERFH|nr:hypothetical protein C2S53_010110 [Perilla frutescens var. hirtella]
MEIPCEAEKRSAAMEIEMKKRGASYKYGLVGPFLWKFPFEDREHVPASEYYDNSDSHFDCEDRPIWTKLRDPNAHEPPDTKDERTRSILMRAIHFAIGKINAETGKTYEFVKVENAVFTRSSLFLLTFTVKDSVDSSLETLRAMVGIPYSDKEEYTLEEWMYKPLPATAAAKPDPEKKKAKMGESTDLGSLNREIVEKIFSFLDDKSATNLSLTCKNCFSARPSPSPGKP